MRILHKFPKCRHQKRFDELSGTYEDAKRWHDDTKQQIDDKLSARTSASQFIDALNKMEGLIMGFAPSPLGNLPDPVPVCFKEDARYTFIN